MYNISAFLYEKTGAFEVPESTCDEIHQLLIDNGAKAPGILGDLGSGTGLMGILFAQKGWNVQGIELSEAMIKVAQEHTQKLPEEIQQRISWTQGDISKFELTPESLDAAICLCNTINHLAEWEQVTAFLQRACLALKKNAVLILDSDTLDTFKGFFDHKPTVVLDDGKYCMTRACKFNEDTGRANHTARVSKYTNGKLRPVAEEAMSLQYHSEKQLIEAFQQHGFTIKNALPYNPFPRLYQGFIPKVLWVLVKTA